MKSYKLLFLVFLVSSCSNKAKLEGDWYYNFESKGAWDYERPSQMIIKNDSIHFNYLYFNHWESFSLKANQDSIYLNDYAIKYNFEKDTLILNNFQKFTRVPFGRSKSMVDYKSDIIINLPRLNDSLFKSSNENDYQILKYVGINPKTNKYALLFGDKYISFKNLIDVWGFGGSHSVPRDYFNFDKNTKMELVEMVLMDSQIKNLLRVSFVNNIKLNYSDSTGLKTNYQILKKSIFPFVMSNEYFKNHAYSNYENAPPPLPPPPKFKNEDYSKTKVVSLIKDSLYFENSKIQIEDLKKIVEESIENHSPIISIYDLESNYSSFLELNALISSIYRHNRNSLSNNIYGKPLDNLNREKELKIKNQIPIIHIWNYSIPHFNKIIEEDGNFYGLEID